MPNERDLESELWRCRIAEADAAEKHSSTLMLCAGAAFIVIGSVSFAWFTTTQPRYINGEFQNGAVWLTFGVEALSGLLWWTAVVNRNRRRKQAKEIEREVEAEGFYVTRYASAPPSVGRATF